MLKRNKKAGIGIIIFFGVLFLALIIGFVGTLIYSVIDYTSDEITPIMEDLGMVDEVNLSEGASYTFTILDNTVQGLGWVIAIMYILSLIFTLVFVFMSGYSPHPAYIPLFLVFMILLIFGSVIFSNMYQDIYTGNDDIATRLQEQTITSYLILHSPFIMGIIAVIGGILMFTRQSSAEGGSEGGYGI